MPQLENFIIQAYSDGDTSAKFGQIPTMCLVFPNSEDHVVTLEDICLKLVTKRAHTCFAKLTPKECQQFPSMLSALVNQVAGVWNMHFLFN